MTKKPAPAIGLRTGHRVDGAPFLHGIASQEIVIPAGSRLSLRRVAPDGSGKATHVIVIAPPVPGISDTKSQIEQARIDAMWCRDDPRDEVNNHPRTREQ